MTDEQIEQLQAELAAMKVWQGRASELVNIVAPSRSFRAGEFESLDDAQWATLLADLRTKAGTDHAAELASVKAQLAQASKRYAAEQAAKAAGLTDAQIEDLRSKA